MRLMTSPDLNNDSVMAGLVPRLSGSGLTYSEAHLSLILSDLRRRMEQIVYWSAMHKVGADQSCKHEWACNNLLGCLSEAQQKKGNQRDGDLDPHRMLGGADKPSDLQGLLDPPKEQFNGPTSTIQISNVLRAGVQVVRQDAQHLSLVGRDPYLA